MTYQVMGDWIVSTSPYCTCGTNGAGGAHESMCGVEQEAPLSELNAWVTTLQARAKEQGRTEAASRVRGLHSVASPNGEQEHACMCAEECDSLDRAEKAAKGE